MWNSKKYKTAFNNNQYYLFLSASNDTPYYIFINLICQRMIGCCNQRDFVLRVLIGQPSKRGEQGSKHGGCRLKRRNSQCFIKSWRVEKFNSVLCINTSMDRWLQFKTLCSNPL